MMCFIVRRFYSMEKKRKINRWDRRRSNKRLRRLKESEKYKKTESTLDSLNIRLPELSEKQKKEIEKDLIKKKK
jgi:hypothetical protein